MSAPKGNNYTEKFKTPAERQRVFKSFCAHLADGYSPKTFHDGCVENTIIRMLETYPHEFDLDDILMAKAKGNFVWEEMGKRGTAGAIDGFNSSSWKMIMGNKLNWKEKVEQSSDPENPPEGIVSPADRAVIEHFKKRAVLEYQESTKPKKEKK